MGMKGAMVGRGPISDLNDPPPLITFHLVFDFATFFVTIGTAYKGYSKHLLLFDPPNHEQF